MEPDILLVDEPSIGLEPRFIDMVFDILADLQQTEGKTILMVEQNAKKGLEFADIGYVLVSGQIAKVGRGDDLLNDPDVGPLVPGWLKNLTFSSFRALDRSRGPSSLSRAAHAVLYLKESFTP